MNDQASPRCPRCAGPLTPGHARRTDAHACGRCGGVWLGVGGWRIVESLEADTAAVKVAVAASHGATAAPDPRPAIHCPSCGATLERRVPHGSGVSVDGCTSHGIWFDRDELQALAAAVRRRRRADSQIEGQRPGRPRTAAADHGDDAYDLFDPDDTIELAEAIVDAFD